MESADTISDIHGGGSPEAHRVTIFRETDIKSKIKAAKRLAGIEDGLTEINSQPFHVIREMI